MLTTDATTIKKSRVILERLFRKELNKYIDLFFYEKEVLLNRQEAKVLESAGIIRSSKRAWIANVMIFPYKGKFITTDFLLSVYRTKDGRYLRNIDDVWVMFPHETLLFIDSLDRNGSIALDIASGSGAISLFLADRFKKVVSSDINPKAVSYARFNAVLNNFENKIVNIQSDLFQNIKSSIFDYIVWNGPTVAMPEVNQPEKVYPLYTYGGFDGAEFTKNFLREVFDHVKLGYKIKWWDGSLGNKKQSSVEQFIKKEFQNRPIKVTIEFLNKRRGVPLKEYDQSYAKYCLGKFDLNQTTGRVVVVSSWYKKLKEFNMTHVYITLISIEPNDKFKVIYRDCHKTLVGPRQVFGFEWHHVSSTRIRKYLLENNKNY